ncbi:MAG TPA: hypothetical protein VN428_12495 [Bryobacteraceae bacterium]|nr:hypothetical protein [Bryobacteraceae bacterium]
MPERRYYSIRTGRRPGGVQLDLPTFKRLFLSLYSDLDEEGWFQEAFGFECVDSGMVFGALGRDVRGEVLLALRKDDLWPVRSWIDNYSEDDLFDVIEFLFDYVSFPTKRDYHDWNQCGWHCSEFDPIRGKATYREKINRLLNEYSAGFELSEQGEVLRLGDDGLRPLLAAKLPDGADEANVRNRVDAAVLKFRRHSATSEDRRDALRDLADVLEYLRPEVREVLEEKDEADLFNLANNFGIRHHNAKQKTRYDKAIWYSWSFYYYLATIHASLHLLERKPGSSRS